MKRTTLTLMVCALATATHAEHEGRITLFGQTYRVDRIEYVQSVSWPDPLGGATELNLLEPESLEYVGSNRFITATDEMDFFGSYKNVVLEIELVNSAETGFPEDVDYVRTILVSDPDTVGYDLDPGGVTVNTGFTGLAAGGNVVVISSDREMLEGYSSADGAALGEFPLDPNTNAESVQYMPTLDEFWSIWQEGPYSIVRHSTSGALLGTFPIAGEINSTISGEPKGMAFLDDVPTFPDAFAGLGGAIIVTMDDAGPGIQALDLAGNEVAYESLNDANGNPRLPQAPCNGVLQIEAASADPETGRIFLMNQSDLYACGYLWVLTPACPSDWNLDGFVSGDDFDLFISLFEAGDPGADFNGDTFVSGDDFDGYVLAFEAGC